MSRTLVSLLGAGVAVAASVALTFAQQPPTFRTATDLIAVDVQVVDKAGGPVAGLGPGQFQVSIDGKSRKVVAADFIRADAQATSSLGPMVLGNGLPNAPAIGQAPDPGRVFILAFDTMSFPQSGTAPAQEAARAFVGKLMPADLAGMVALPSGPMAEASTDRTKLLDAIDGVVGQADPASIDPYRLSASDIVDLTIPEVQRVLFAQAPIPAAVARTLPPQAVQKLGEICSNAGDPDTCQHSIGPYADVRAKTEEMQIAQRLSSLQSVLRSLATSPRRKILLLISAGIMATDRPTAHPEIGDIGKVFGQSAAEADCAIYVLHFDRLTSDQSAALRPSGRRYDVQRDEAILARPLGDIAGTAGGTYFHIVSGAGEFAFNRVLNETSAYYLLGVEPTPKDRDGKPHELRVKVAPRDVTLRSRMWVTMAKPTPAPPPTPAAAAPAAPASRARPPARRSISLAAEPRPLSDSVRPIAEAYAARDYAAVDRLVRSARNLASLLDDVLVSDAPGPDAPRRWPALSLELAIAGLGDSNAYARDNGLKLLTQAHVRMEHAAENDAFACEWFVAEAAGIESVLPPSVSRPYVQRASLRCPAEPRLKLALGVVLEQAARLDPAIKTNDTLEAYRGIDPQSAAAVEGRIRTAWLLYRSGDIAAARQALPPTAPDDTRLTYFFSLVSGHIQRANGELDAAEQSFGRALEAAAGAQSARVALVALLLDQGRAADAAALADTVEAASPDGGDPWWTYGTGDFHRYQDLIAALREAAR
jgi:VWFA-related protein